MLTDKDKQWLAEQFARVETELVTAFRQWTSPTEMRARSHAAVLRAMDEEIESRQDRIKRLEGGEAHE